MAGFKTKICPTAWFFHDVSNRRPNPVLEHQMLLSGRYLGEKWGVPEFRDHIEKLILEKGMTSDAKLLPSLSDVRPIVDPRRWGIVEFRKMFHFSSVRWE